MKNSCLVEKFYRTDWVCSVCTQMWSLKKIASYNNNNKTQNSFRNCSTYNKIQALFSQLPAKGGNIEENRKSVNQLIYRQWQNRWILYLF